jgi:hypothetical protein
VDPTYHLILMTGYRLALTSDRQDARAAGVNRARQLSGSERYADEGCRYYELAMDGWSTAIRTASQFLAPPIAAPVADGPRFITTQWAHLTIPG